MGDKWASGLMWFRRDLRAHDNAALYHALKRCHQVYCVFVFDTDILSALPRQDRRVEFIRESVCELDTQLRQLGLQLGHQLEGQLSHADSFGLICLHASARDALPHLAQALGVQAVFANHDDEPASASRDAAVRGSLAAQGIHFFTSKDHVIFERNEVLTQSGTPFSVFTPYKSAWLKRVNAFYLKPYPCARYAAALAARPLPWRTSVPILAELGFESTNLADLNIPTGARGAERTLEDFCGRIDQYHQTRDFPGIKGPSYLGVHLRFGTLSIRQLAGLAYALNIAGRAGATVFLA